MVIFILGLLYPSLTSRIFSIFRCVDVPGEGRYLKSDFSVQCGQTHHVQLMILGVAATLLYTIGFPTFLLVMLWRARAVMHDASHVDHHLVQLQLGSLYLPYERSYWFFEPVVIVYKMIMVGALSIIGQDSPVQLFIGFVVATIYMCAVLRTAPYVDPDLDRLAFACGMSQCMILCLALMKSIDQNRGAEVLVSASVLGTAFIAFSAVPIVVSLISAAQKVAENRSSMRTQAASGKRASVVPTGTAVAADEQASLAARAGASWERAAQLK